MISCSHHFRFAVSRDRIQLPCFIEQILVGAAVIAAGGCKQKSKNTRVLGEARKTNACPIVDVVGEFGIEIAQRIVGECSQMNDGVDNLQVRDVDISYVFTMIWDFDNLSTGLEGAAFIKIAVVARVRPWAIPGP